MKTINAFIYPTPEEFDRQIEEARCARLFSRLHRIPLDFGTRIHEQLSAAFDPRNHLSPDDHDPIDFSQLERRLAQQWLQEIGVKNPERFIPDAPDEFVWASHNGSRFHLSDMATKHVFYALRMIYNHTVAPVFRVLRPGETMKYYPDVPYWDADYRRRAVDAFVAELAERDDLDEDLARQYGDMQANTRVILALGL